MLSNLFNSVKMLGIVLRVGYTVVNKTDNIFAFVELIPNVE